MSPRARPPPNELDSRPAGNHRVDMSDPCVDHCPTKLKAAFFFADAQQPDDLSLGPWKRTRYEDRRDSYNGY
jgi:hypothetical protein